MRLKDKVAVVTGASRGIGRAIALAFAHEGAKLALCATNQPLLDSLAAEISDRFGQKPLTFSFDIRNAQEMTNAVKKILDTHSRIDILLNNAGATRDQLLVMMPEEDWDFVLSVNLKSAYLFAKAVTRPMIRQRAGRIISITSIVGINGNAGQTNYAASKAGLIGFTKSLAKELAKRNITVNAIAPGFIKTQMTDGLSEEIKTEVNHRIPLGRFGEPEDIAQTAVFLASDQAAYITGQVIRVDGGLDM